MCDKSLIKMYGNCKKQCGMTVLSQDLTKASCQHLSLNFGTVPAGAIYILTEMFDPLQEFTTV